MKTINLKIVGRWLFCFVYLIHFYVYSSFSVIVIPLRHGRDTGQYVKVYMRDGSVLFGGYIVFESESRGKKELAIHLNEDGRKIKPFETDSIEVDFLIGKPFNNDSCWLYKIINGKISAYSVEPLWETKQFSHIQKGNGPIKPYSRKLLSSYLSDKKYTEKIFNKIWLQSETRLRYLDSKEAILEYNYKVQANKEKVGNLLRRVRESPDIKAKYDYAKLVFGIDSTNYIAFEVFGDYEMSINQDSVKAYNYYTNSLRYCPTKFYLSAENKIRAMGKPVLY